MLKLAQAPVLGFLSVLLIFYGLVPIISPVPPSKWLYDAENVKEAIKYGANATIAPVLVGMRNATGQFDFTHRKQQNFTLYYIFHVFPSVLWCLLLPLQHVKSLRRKFLSLHKLSGYLTILLSTVISISGLMFPFWSLSYTDSDFWHLHRLRVGPETFKTTVMIWPTFKLQTSFLGFITIAAGYLTLSSALRRDMRAHRQWSTVYTHIGYIVPLHRFWTLVYQIVGVGLPFLSPAVREWLSVPTAEKDIFAAEVAANAWASTMGGVASISLWLLNEGMLPKEKLKTK